ncbi:MAG: hypothetical protein KJ645_08825, partial [Planctomycetes bacterium]|nr:hypothetical protein [Planctomycetota bacterium]
DWDEALDIAVGPEGAAFIVGGTWSSQGIEQFPVIVGPDLSYNGSRDGFVVKIEWQNPLMARSKPMGLQGGMVKF